MNIDQIDNFFKQLNAQLQIPCEIILTGASAGMLMGHIRPSIDIDFEIRPKSAKGQSKFESSGEKIIKQLCSELQIAANYSGDISRWGEVSYLDYRKTAQPYKKFGLLKVKIIAPAYWTIGKMTRYLDQDIRDMVEILSKHSIKPPEIISIWVRALQESDLSLTLSQFKEHVRNFLKQNSGIIWKGKYSSEKLIQQFNQALQIKS
jgi:hypothetical protein